MPLSAGMQINSTRQRMRLAGAKRQWQIQPLHAKARELARSLKVSTMLAQVLINRGITEPQSAGTFLRPKLTELIAPEQMPGAEKAAQRIKQAITNSEKITIYGDYDVDGIAGVSILMPLIRLLGGQVDYYIPHRIDEGYGLNHQAVKALAESGTKLLITVDCGINAIDSAQLAAQSAIDLIVTDHHQPGTSLPQAYAIVHPAMDESYANQNCCGAMVAFKLAWALANMFRAGARLEPKLREHMLNATSLAAMGTVADIMDLRGENRVLTTYGLKSLPHCSLCGIQALIQTAGVTGWQLDSFDVGFRLAPMLNAAGRMGHARLAVELLTSDNEMKSLQIAEYLKQQNQQRRQYERRIYKQACEMIVAQGLNHPERCSIVLAGENWHTGVIGIVASRIVDKYYRPAIMINTGVREDGTAQGSARSIEGFDILGGITACSKYLAGFGGHKMAAGITIEKSRIADFAAEFEAYAKKNLSCKDTVAGIRIDAEAPLSAFGKDAVCELEMLEPFGAGNPKPVFATRGVRLAAEPRICGARGSHLQLAVTEGTASIRCIGFGMGRLQKKLLEQDFFNIAYQPNINNYNSANSQGPNNTSGTRSGNVQLVLADIQFD